ncbi:MAG: PGPGW domain-containing protein [Syntrophorhabdaceae bacterium]|nr:PGPGW domain-containing protein [Syntrophorhabdaceae bacterium]
MDISKLSKYRFRYVKRIIVGAAGLVVLSIGIGMVVLPGPAFLVIPLGLSILAAEFEWAKRIRDKGRVWLNERKQVWRDGRTGHAKSKEKAKKNECLSRGAPEDYRKQREIM